MNVLFILTRPNEGKQRDAGSHVLLRLALATVSVVCGPELFASVPFPLHTPIYRECPDLLLGSTGWSCFSDGTGLSDPDTMWHLEKQFRITNADSLEPLPSVSHFIKLSLAPQTSVKTFMNITAGNILQTLKRLTVLAYWSEKYECIFGRSSPPYTECPRRNVPEFGEGFPYV
jgi:hypothetical protein